MNAMDLVKNYLNEEGKVTFWPSKHKKKEAVLLYLAAKFECGRDYTEKEINEIIDAWHTFGDYFLLRRELVDHKLLSRTPNGARYWKEEQKESGADL